MFIVLGVIAFCISRWDWGLIEEMVEVFGDGMGDEAVGLVEFFLFGGGIKWGSEGVFLVRKVLLDHGEEICFCGLFITAN